jgi:EAL domain-containing protein (putative c-di-GMP-specific phosphodiesterase class I)/GGDEF domain-containing protein
MLLSEQEERGRKFKLALRAGIPVFILIALVAYGTFFQDNTIQFGLREFSLAAALVFVTTYFIFFLLEEDSQKTLVDHTTNSYNYPAFLHHFKTHKPRSVALLIIDNLSIINENYGTRDVDTMLRSLVYQLDGTLAAHGIRDAIIGRKHGAEFLIGTESEEERIRQAVQSFVTDHPSIQEIEIDYRFGTVGRPKEPLEKIIWHIHDMIQLTQTAPSSKPAKKEPTLQTSDAPGELEASIVEAIHADRVLFTFRPLHHVKKGAVDTYEIAARLQLSNGKELLPRVYLPIINRLGFGRDYDYAILKHALGILPLIDESIAFSFNLSPFSLRNKDFQAKAYGLLDQSGIAPSRLIIELYERKTHHNLEGYLKTLESFRARGLRICIDNFGSSNASMEYMRHFKFDMVQFDRDYVGNLQDQNSLAMLQSLVDMSKSLRITTVAKWVDKEDQKQKLIAMGVDYLQGFGIAKPISEEKLINTYN